MKNKPTIVVCTGRCGSSMVARVLFHLGVNMGETFPLPIRTQPAGYFEDVDMGLLCSRRLKGFIGVEEWRSSMSSLIEKRHTSEHWGWKNPITTHLLPEILKLTGGAKFIWIRRDKKKTIKSMRKHWRINRWDAKRRFERDDNYLRQFLHGWRTDPLVATNVHGVLEIWFDEHMDRIKIVEDIIKFIDIKPTENQVQRALESILLPPAPVVRSTKSSLWKHND